MGSSPHPMALSPLFILSYVVSFFLLGADRCDAVSVLLLYSCTVI